MQIDPAMMNMMESISQILNKPALLARVKELIALVPPQKISAIKEVRAVTGMGLKEAKDAVEEIMIWPDHYQPAPTMEANDITHLIVQHIRDEAVKHLLAHKDDHALLLRDLADEILSKFLKIPVAVKEEENTPVVPRADGTREALLKALKKEDDIPF